MFSDKYLTTVGVKIDKKTVTVDGNEVMLMIWDLAGDDDYQRLQTSYLRGTRGYLWSPMVPAMLPWTRQSKFRAA